ncbi:hypothetical protein FACS1894202_03740 [Clostridia bacterium]|nr:hypothetical protein FACS1894202_03740 [Clostridia bacterium]
MENRSETLNNGEDKKIGYAERLGLEKRTFTANEAFRLTLFAIERIQFLEELHGLDSRERMNKVVANSPPGPQRLSQTEIDEILGEEKAAVDDMLDFLKGLKH